MAYHVFLKYKMALVSEDYTFRIYHQCLFRWTIYKWLSPSYSASIRWKKINLWTFSKKSFWQLIKSLPFKPQINLSNIHDVQVYVLSLLPMKIKEDSFPLAKAFLYSSSRLGEGACSTPHLFPSFHRRILKFLSWNLIFFIWIPNKFHLLEKLDFFNKNTSY